MGVNKSASMDGCGKRFDQGSGRTAQSSAKQQHNNDDDEQETDPATANPDRAANNR